MRSSIARSIGNAAALSVMIAVLYMLLAAPAQAGTRGSMLVPAQAAPAASKARPRHYISVYGLPTYASLPEYQPFTSATSLGTSPGSAGIKQGLQAWTAKAAQWLDKEAKYVGKVAKENYDRLTGKGVAPAPSKSASNGTAQLQPAARPQVAAQPTPQPAGPNLKSDFVKLGQDLKVWSSEVAQSTAIKAKSLEQAARQGIDRLSSKKTAGSAS